MPKTELAKIVGERIRSLRKKQKLSQEELAHLAAIHPTYIGQLERGEKNVTIDTLEKITNALNISLEELFRFSGLNKDVDGAIVQLNKHLSEFSDQDRETLLDMINILIDWRDRTNKEQPSG
ncbi:helix-turn-helix domain-containing protein [Aquibacillus koreensis]|uniref:Helix-turn-helix domain-containing protein n=1 Tax=Aquibacillus koreensis TaxID=279446 RepID=A0A9X3WP69_9BACI|nr:helix-turn-helix transcriptional regulator [Aquibacillus koreensis]MCT2534469.1 helix-turn-helix domain-containing protein [Aquibacillus koreensis]MDC3421776.1 helix-turn-helix domain-containing protein [Aquibacillus koreensis]